MARYLAVCTTASSAHSASSTSSLDLTRLNMISITPAEVQNELERIKTQTSFGPDGLHLKQIRKRPPIIASPISGVFNKLLETGIPPEGWTSANISLIFKAGARNQPAD